MTAVIISPVSGQPTSMDAWPVILESNGATMSQIITETRRAISATDVDVRAEFRLWGSYPHAMARMVGRSPERDAKPAGRVLAIGGLRGPDAIGSASREDGRQWLQSREVGRFGSRHIGSWVF